MRNKSLFIVAAVAAAAAATAAIVISSRTSSESGAKAGAAEQPLFPGLRDKVGDVAKLKLKRGTVDVTVARTPGDTPKWVVESKGNFPAEFDMVRRAIGGLAEADIVEAKTSRPEFYDKIGVGEVDKPGATGTHIQMFDGADKLLAGVTVGTPSRETAPQEPGGSKPRYFVRKDGDPQAYVAKGDLSFQPDPMTWLNRTITEVDAGKVKSMTVTQSVNGQPQTIRVFKNAPGEQKFQLENLPAGRQMKDEFAANRVGQSLAGAITMDDVTPAMGMDFSKPDATVEAALFDGEVVIAKMITKDNKKWWAIEARYEEPSAAGAPLAPAPGAPPAPPQAAPQPAPPSGASPSGSNPALIEQPQDDKPAPAPAAAPQKPQDAKPDVQPDQAQEAAAKTEAAKAEAAKAEAAKAAADEKAATTKRVAELNEKCGPWAYVLPEYKVTAMLVKLEDLLKPAETPAPTAPAPAPVPQDQGSLLGPH